jgi:hypothetical protein
MYLNRALGAVIKWFSEGSMNFDVCIDVVQGSILQIMVPGHLRKTAESEKLCSLFLHPSPQKHGIRPSCERSKLNPVCVLISEDIGT